MNNQWFSKVAVWLVIALVLFTVFKQFETRPGGSSGYMGYSDFLEEVRAKRIKTATIQEGQGGTEIVAVTMSGFPAVINVEQAPDSVTVDDVTYKHLLPNAKLGSMPVHEYLDLAATSLARFVLDYKPSVLHIGSGHRGFETALVGRAVAEWFGIPWLYEVRSFFETTWTSDKRYMERAPYFHQRHATESRCMRAADFVVTLSGPMRDEIIERHGIDAEKVTGIPNAVDVERFAPQPRDEVLRASLGLSGSYVLGYVSNLSHPREGQETMIAALPKIRATGIPAKVLLVGDGARRRHDDGRDGEPERLDG